MRVFSAPRARGSRQACARLAGHLLDQVDDAAAQLGVLDPHEGLDQCEPVGGREKIG